MGVLSHTPHMIESPVHEGHEGSDVGWLVSVLVTVTVGPGTGLLVSVLVTVGPGVGDAAAERTEGEDPRVTVNMVAANAKSKRSVNVTTTGPLLFGLGEGAGRVYRSRNCLCVIHSLLYHTQEFDGIGHFLSSSMVVVLFSPLMCIVYVILRHRCLHGCRNCG
jgi:hypothetical protein